MGPNAAEHTAAGKANDDNDALEWELDLDGDDSEAPRRLAVFPVVPDTMQGLLSLLQIKSVRRMVVEYFFRDGTLTINYPERGKTLPNQHKACRVCGRLGHNTTTHHKTLGLAAEAARHVLCLMKNGETMQSEEVVRQIELVLGALAGITLVAQDNATPLVLKTVREIKVLYDNLLSWATHRENRHARFVALSRTFDADTQILVGPSSSSSAQDTEKLCYRSTLRAAKVLMDKVTAGPAPPMPPSAFSLAEKKKNATRIFLFPEMDLDENHHARLMTTFTQLFGGSDGSSLAAQYARVAAGHRFHCVSESTATPCGACGAEAGATFGAEYDVSTFAACRTCRFLGHIANVCAKRTPGTKMLLCLATLLDERKQHRLDNAAVRRSLVNVQRVIMALGYRYWASDGAEDVLCRFELTRFRAPSLKPCLLVLMRTFNHAVAQLVAHPHLGKNVVLLGNDLHIHVGDAADAKLPAYTEALRRTVVTVLSNPDLLPTIVPRPQTAPGSPVGAVGVKMSERILRGLTSTGRESGLAELRAQTDRGGLTDEELEAAAAAILERWRTPHVPTVTAQSVCHTGVSESFFMY